MQTTNAQKRCADASSSVAIFFARVVVPHSSFPNPRVDKIAGTLEMEIVAAADSDERGLTLLRLVNILRKVLSYIQGFGSSSERVVDRSSESSNITTVSANETKPQRPSRLSTTKLKTKISIPKMDETAVSQKVSL